MINYYGSSVLLFLPSPRENRLRARPHGARALRCACARAFILSHRRRNSNPIRDSHYHLPSFNISKCNCTDAATQPTRIIYNHSLLSHYYYVRSGFIDLSNNALKGIGSNCVGWSKESYFEALFAYNLAFNNSVVYPSDDYYRYVAFPVHLNPQTLSPDRVYNFPTPVYTSSNSHDCESLKNHAGRGKQDNVHYQPRDK